MDEPAQSRRLFSAADAADGMSFETAEDSVKVMADGQTNISPWCHRLIIHGCQIADFPSGKVIRAVQCRGWVRRLTRSKQNPATSEIFRPGRCETSPDRSVSMSWAVS